MTYLILVTTWVWTLDLSILFSSEDPTFIVIPAKVELALTGAQFLDTINGLLTDKRKSLSKRQIMYVNKGSR